MNNKELVDDGLLDGGLVDGDVWSIVSAVGFVVPQVSGHGLGRSLFLLLGLCGGPVCDGPIPGSPGRRH